MAYSQSGWARRNAVRLGAAGAVAAAMAAGVLASTGAAQAASQPLVSLPGTVTPAVSGAQRVGSVDAGQRMSVAVALNLRNTAQLAEFDRAVSTPGSAQYGHYVTPAQFADRYSPTTADVAAVRQFLSSTGLTVTGVSGNRQVVDATGTAAQVAAAFHTNMSNYRDGAKTFYANDNAAAVPTSVASVVAGVIGLNDHTVAHPAANPHAGPVGGLSPTQVDGAYRFNQVGTTGSGVTIALWEFDGYKSSNLTTYNSQYGLTGPAATTVSVDGANYDSSPGGGEVEVELDSEVARAVAPAATQLVYEAPNSDQGGIDMANKIVSDGRASVISISWGECEQDTTQASITGTDNAFAQAVAQGISIYSAAGDDGSRDCTRTPSGSGVKAVDYPGSSVYDTSVGGTTLTLGTGNTYGSESTWSGGGGGVSVKFAKPSWQTAGSGTMRTVPDVSSDADPNSGFSEFTGGSWTEVGGTSAAAPTWAGFTALYNQKAAAAGKANLGFANPAIYQLGGGSKYASTFHDVTAGSNGDYSATTGYDDATGWGSPIADGLTTALLGGGSTGGNTVAVASPGNQSTVAGTAVNLAVHATDSGAGTTLTYSATGLPTGLSISTAGVITGTPTTAGTSSVTVKATDNTGASGTATFTWTVTTSGGGGGCAAPGQKLGNPGFEAGNTVWSASSGVIGQNGSQGEPTHAGTWNAWLDGYGSTHTDTLSQSVTIPSGCGATLSFYLHIDTAETTTSSQFDKLTVKIGSTTLATFSNLDAASGYTPHSYNVSTFAGQTVTLTFTGTEDSSQQTSFVIDDTAVTTS